MEGERRMEHNRNKTYERTCSSTTYKEAKTYEYRNDDYPYKELASQHDMDVF